MISGSQKTLTDFNTSPDTMLMGFKNDIKYDAHDEGIDEIGCGIHTKLMEYLTDNGVKTHHLRRTSDTEVEVLKLTMLPFDVVVRNRASGSFCSRYKVKKGLGFQNPVIEFKLRGEEISPASRPVICDTSLLGLGIANGKQLALIRSMAVSINFHLKRLFEKKFGFQLVDFKMEFGYPFGQDETDIRLGDDLTLDHFRLWNDEDDPFEVGIVEGDDIVAAYQYVLNGLT